MSRASITDVPGVAVGHAEVPGGASGCTVVLGPFRGAVDVRGMATGTREMDALEPEHVVPRIDAVLLTGGSAHGLAAADGVMGWLEERGRGFDTGVARVPIVPAAVIFDLAEGRARPGAAQGRAACEAAAGGPVPEGRVGAGAGALVGKIRGRAHADAGGIGSYAVEAGGFTVGALVAVNALGDVLDDSGRILAGARDDDGEFVDTASFLRRGGVRGEFGSNTTLAVVATDAPLSQVDLGRLARVASTAMARRISPVNTPFDGDVTFAVSTGDEVEAFTSGEVMALGVAARDTLERSIERAVAAAFSSG